MKTLGYAAQSATSPLEPFTFQRRALRPNDIVMEILYCGICHTDLHQARNDWGFSTLLCLAMRFWAASPKSEAKLSDTRLEMPSPSVVSSIRVNSLWPFKPSMLARAYRIATL